MIGIFCVDPGNHTGVAWGVVDEAARLAHEAVGGRIGGGSATLTGEPMEQARALWALWEQFKTNCVVVGRMDPEKVELVFEDFVLIGGQHSGGRDGTSPERITWAFEGYRHGRFDTFRKEKHFTSIIWQMPSAASIYKERPRLESANAWIRGREHERSAFSHMLLRVNTIMNSRNRPRR